MAENLFDKVEEISKDVKEMKGQTTLQEQLDNKDPKVFEFITDAKLKWIWQGEKSDFRIKEQKRKKSIVTQLVFSILQVLLLIYPIFLTIYAIIPFTVSLVIYGFYNFVLIKKFLFKRSYEMDYSALNRFWVYYDLDDNDIICDQHNKWWLKILRVFAKLVPFISALSLFFINAILELGALDLYIITAITFVFGYIHIVIFNKNYFGGYTLFLVKGKDKLSYSLLKDIIEENEIKLNK